jgi:hypothetical protein
MIMLIPSETFPGLEPLLDIGTVGTRGRDHLEGTRQETGVAFVGHRHRLLFGNRVRPGLCVIGHIPARRLVARLFADIPFSRLGCFREFSSRHRVETGDSFSQKLLKLVVIHRHRHLLLNGTGGKFSAYMYLSMRKSVSGAYRGTMGRRVCSKGGNDEQVSCGAEQKAKPQGP